ncbi:hypothetical protein M9Y10_019762 [Tritrichomonas musculus]|uniref:Uncharacterized protein n=1 Tax=Tritrichomonas musculus TaxID=1915356 RepID=A0ABR2HH62_9EUKA
MTLDNEKFISKLKKSEILLLPGFDASDKKTKLADLKMKLHNNVHYSLKKTGARVKDYIAAYNKRDEIKQQQIESTKKLDEKISINKKFERSVYQEINKIKVQARKVYDKFEHNDEEVIEYRNNEDIQKLLKSGEIIDDVYINLNKEYETIEQANRITKKTEDEYIKLFKNKFGFKPKVHDIFYLAKQQTESVLKDARVDIQRILKYLNAKTVPKTYKPKIDKLKAELLNAPDDKKEEVKNEEEDEIDDEFFETARKREQQQVEETIKNIKASHYDKTIKSQPSEPVKSKAKPNVVKTSQIKTAKPKTEPKPKDERQKIIDEIVNVRNEAKPKPIDDDSNKPTVDDYANETQFKNYKQIQQTFPDVDRDIINEIYWSFAQIAHLYIDRCSTNENERLRKLKKLVIHKVEGSATKEPATINAILTCLSMMLSFNKLWKKDKSKMFDSYQLNEWLPASYFSFKSAKNFDKSFTNDMLYPEYRYFMSISLHDIDTEIKKSVEKQYGFFIDDLGNKATLDNKTNKSDDEQTFYEPVSESSVKPKPKVEPEPEPKLVQEINHESSVKPEPKTVMPTKIKTSMILESEPLKKIKMIPAKIVSSIPEQQLEQQLEEKRKKLNLAPPPNNDEDFLKIKQFNYKKLNRKIYSSIDFEIQDVITGAAVVCDDKYQKLMRKTKIDNKDRKSEKWKSLFNEIYVGEYEYKFGIKPLKIPKHDIVLNGGLLDTTISYVDKNDIKHVFNHRLNNPIPPHVKREAEEKAKREAEQQRLQELFVNSKINELKSSPPPKLKSDFEPVEPPSQLPTIEDKPFEDMETAGSIDNSSLQTQQQETYNNFMNPDFELELASDEYDYAFDHVI